jgi:hypothetical protein
MAKLSTAMMKVVFYDCVRMGCTRNVGWAAMFLRMLRQLGLGLIADQIVQVGENSHGQWGHRHAAPHHQMGNCKDSLGCHMGQGLGGGSNHPSPPVCGWNHACDIQALDGCLSCF